MIEDLETTNRRRRATRAKNSALQIAHRMSKPSEQIYGAGIVYSLAFVVTDAAFYFRHSADDGRGPVRFNRIDLTRAQL